MVSNCLFENIPLIHRDVLVAGWFLNIMVLIGHWKGGKKFLCHDGVPSQQEYGPCGLQGCFSNYLIFFFLIIILNRSGSAVRRVSRIWLVANQRN